MSDFLTTRQVGEILSQPEWRIRRVVDCLDGVQRFGGKRLIPRLLLPTIITQLESRAAQVVEGAR